MTFTLRDVLRRLAEGEKLSEADTEAAFGLLMEGEATPAQIAGLLMAMRLRGETVPEITGAARAMRARMLTVEAPPGAIDTCGTGGDAAGTYNISTAASFVIAAAGVTVAKHGNRAASSKSGAADVLAALGVALDAPMERIQVALDTPPASPSCGRHGITRPCATWRGRARNSATAPSSTCSGRSRTPAG